MSTKKKILIGVGALGVFVFLLAGWQGARAYLAWNSIERIEFDLESAREALPAPVVATEVPVTSTTTTIVPQVSYDTVLVIGTDERPEGSSSPQERVFADAVMLYMVPDDGSGPLIVSIPRDLVVVNPCTGEETKLDRTLAGCGEDIGGEELVALTVEDYTGITVGNFASFRFEALIKIVDAVDGVEVCVPYALREGTYDIVPEGCSTVDGERALRWIRSRRTQEFVDGQWRFAQSNGDAGRVQRQQTLIFALLDELKGIRSPTELAGLAEQLGDTIVLDETLGISDAVAMVWDLRSVSGGTIRTVTIPTTPVTLDDGSFAVRATTEFATVLSG